MSTKKFGYVLTVLGAILIIASLLVGHAGAGDPNIQAGRMLGREIGIFILLLGGFLVYFFPNREVNLRNGIRGDLERLFNLPVSAWVIAGFLINYFFFFLLPVFLNPDHVMHFFGRYLPNYDPIGFDIRAVLEYIRNWLVSNQSPYFDKFIAYPPLVLALFAPLLLLGYPAYYYFITFVTLLFYTLSTLWIPVKSNRGRTNSLVLMLFALGLFSYGFQFELEKGQSNMIAFSLALIAVYLYHSRKEYDLLAYLLFSIGLQMKIYPAILIVFFTRDWRDWKGNIKRVVGILLFNLALLFVLGPQMLKDFLNAVKAQQGNAGSWAGSHAMKGYVYYLASDDFKFAGPHLLALLKQYREWIYLSLLIVLGLCLLSVLLYSYWRRRAGLNPYLLVICTICALVIPSISNDYKLPILTAPMAMLWGSISMPENRLRRALSILLILMTSVAYWFTLYPPGIKPEIISRSFPDLYLLLIVVTILSFIAPWQPDTSTDSRSEGTSRLSEGLPN